MKLTKLIFRVTKRARYWENSNSTLYFANYNAKAHYNANAENDIVSENKYVCRFEIMYTYMYVVCVYVLYYIQD